MITTSANESLNQIKDLTCISGMVQNDKELFYDIFIKYYDKITKQPEVITTDFTPHAFSHICDLYNIISTIFVEPIQDDKAKFNSKELLMLNLGVYFHDVGMHQKLLDEETRSQHAKIAADKAKEFLNDYFSTKEKSSVCGTTGIEFIAKICGSHSNTNGGDDDLNISNLEVCYQPLETAQIYIRLRLIAAVLRMADELDICNSRVETAIHTKSNSSMPEDVQISDMHWELCTMFALPTYNKEKNAIQVVLDERYLDAPAELSRFQIEKFKQIKIYLDKLNCSLKKYFIDVLCGKQFSSAPYVNAKDKFYCFDDGTVPDYTHGKPMPEYYKDISIEVTDNCDGRAKFWYDNTVGLKKHKETIKNIISQGKKGHIIEHKKLDYIKKYNKDYCIYDYINMHDLIESGIKQFDIDKLLADSFGKLIDKIKSRHELQNEDILIIGIDSIGSIMATSLGVQKNIAIVSYASSIRKSIYPNIEMHEQIRNNLISQIKSKKFIILISDMIYTFTSMLECIDKLNLDVQKTSIFCLFDRKPFEDYITDDKRIQTYNNMRKDFRIYSIIENVKTSFINSKYCAHCMLKERQNENN